MTGQANRSRSASRPRLSRFEIERRVEDGSQRMHLAHCAPRTVYGYALEQGWISHAEFEQAREWNGNLWNYCGD